MVDVAENAVNAAVGRVGGGVVAIVGVVGFANAGGGAGDSDGVDVVVVATVADFVTGGVTSAVLAVGSGALVAVAGSVNIDKDVVVAVEAAQGGVVVEAGAVAEGDGGARGAVVGDVVAVVADGADTVRGVAQTVADAAGLLAGSGRVDVTVGAEGAGVGVGAAAAHFVGDAVAAGGGDGLKREGQEDEFRGEG